MNSDYPVQEFIIRVASLLEIDLILKWAADESWNPGLYDSLSLHVTDPTGFFIGTLDGEPIGSISAVRYSDSFGFIGLLLIKKEYSGRQYAPKLIEVAMEKLKNVTICIDAAIRRKTQYEKLFQFQANHFHTRYQGSPIQCVQANNLLNAKDVSLGDLIKYDGAIFPVPRPAFLTSWFSAPKRNSLVFIQNDAVRGYGVIRACQNGYRVGPLFADNSEVARNLFTNLCNCVDEGPIFIDVPDENASAIELVAQHGFKPIEKNVRMQKNGEVKFDLPRTYGLATLEIG